MRMSRAFQYLKGALLAGLLSLCWHTACYAATDSCGSNDRPSTYQRQPGDQSSSTQFVATRAFSGSGQLEINVCAGQLRIVRAARDGNLHLDITSPGADRNLSGYLQDLQVTGDHAVISVRIPSKYHAVVTLSVPSAAGLHSQVNLGAGTLTLHADALGGDREVNVGAGTAEIYLNGDHDYATMQANIGIGKLDDERPHGHNSYFVISRSLPGSGHGQFDLNVGAGKVVLKAAEE